MIKNLHQNQIPDMSTFINFLIVLMGLSCLSAQILFIREFLIQFNGNELTIGLILGNWLISEAIGSFVFGIIRWRKRSALNIYIITQILISVLLPLGIIAARIIKPLANIPIGQGLGIIPICLFSFLIMFPLGFFLGAQFPLLSHLHKENKKGMLAVSVGSSYFLEALGFGIGGIIITYLFIPHINSVGIAFIIAWINLSATCLLFAKSSGYLRKLRQEFLLLFIVFLGIAGFFLYINFVPCLHTKSIKRQWSGFNLIDYKNSVYGNIAVIKQHEQYTFYYNGMPFMYLPVPDIVFTEDLINFTLGTLAAPENIAVIGSGLGGIINNILNYPVKSIDYAELDPMVIEMGKKYLIPLTARELNDPRLKIHNTDGRLFLNQTNNRFDAIILNLPPPSTLIINRFYTQEFFELSHNRLKDNGIFCFSLPGSASYISREQADLNKCLLETIKSVFPSVFVVPGDTNIYIAAKDKHFKLIEGIIAKNLKQNRIKSSLFTDFYIKEKLDVQKQKWFMQSIKKSRIRQNKDLEPAGVSYTLRCWSALFSPELHSIFLKLRTYAASMSKIFLLLVIAFLVPGIKYFHRKKDTIIKSTLIPLLVFVSGFTGISINLIILLCLQTFYGYVYLHVGLLMSSFMVGLASGSFMMVKKLTISTAGIKTLMSTDSLFAVFCLCFYGFVRILPLLLLKDIYFPFTLTFLAFLSIACGFFVGFEFTLANKIYLEPNGHSLPQPNILYAIDMLGSFTGAILTCILLIPQFGILATIALLFGLKSGLLFLFRAAGNEAHPG
ncbi:MAG: fused MFS/spermidine synthase [Candidatus Omnitrophota bacterium]